MFIKGSNHLWEAWCFGYLLADNSKKLAPQNNCWDPIPYLQPCQSKVVGHLNHSPCCRTHHYDSSWQLLFLAVTTKIFDAWDMIYPGVLYSSTYNETPSLAELHDALCFWGEVGTLLWFVWVACGVLLASFSLEAETPPTGIIGLSGGRGTWLDAAKASEAGSCCMWLFRVLVTAGGEGRLWEAVPWCHSEPNCWHCLTHLPFSLLLDGASKLVVMAVFSVHEPQQDITLVRFCGWRIQ